MDRPTNKRERRRLAIETVVEQIAAQQGNGWDWPIEWGEDEINLINAEIDAVAAGLRDQLRRGTGVARIR